MILIALLLLGMQAEDNNPPSRKAAPLDPNKMICRTQDVTGSLVATKKVCRTRAEWAEEARNARAAYDTLNPHITNCTQSGGC